MAKMVRFNGFEGKYFCSDSPKNLEVGKVYEVITENNLGWQKNYHLRGVKGEYNAKWFSHVDETKEETKV